MPTDTAWWWNGQEGLPLPLRPRYDSPFLTDSERRRLRMLIMDERFTRPMKWIDAWLGEGCPKDYIIARIPLRDVMKRGCIERVPQRVDVGQCPVCDGFGHHCESCAGCGWVGDYQTGRGPHERNN